MIEYYIGLSGGIKSSLVITVFLMVSTIIIGLRVKRLKTHRGLTVGFFMAYWRTKKNRSCLTSKCE